jgi:hypothetical protein
VQKCRAAFSFFWGKLQPEKSNPDAERVEDLSPPEKISVTPEDRKGSSASPRRQPHSRHHARNYSRHIHVGFDLRRQAAGLEPVRRSGSMDARCSWIHRHSEKTTGRLGTAKSVLPTTARLNRAKSIVREEITCAGTSPFHIGCSV